VNLAEFVDLVAPVGDEIVLDVATGTGNAALALAPLVEWVVGLDLTPAMLDEAASAAVERGVRNVTWVVGDAARLPFLDGAFDLYVVRSAPHHFPDLGAALREAARVLKLGGKAVFVDCSPPLVVRDLLHEVEVGRDKTHVRSYTLDEWDTALAEAGFEVVTARRAERDWCVSEWMKTGDVDPSHASALEGMIESAEGEARDALQPTRRAGELWHRYWHAEIVAYRIANDDG
jgi:ubiquinone/menaquinone biosynthesis C-methylase UbiE